MSVPGVVHELVIDVDEEEALRALGYPAGRRPSAAAAERLVALWPEALALLAPRGAWTVVDGAAAAVAGMPSPTELVGVAVGTVGGALEEESRRRSEAGALLDAVLLDAVGSAAAEAAADALNRELCDAASSRGLVAAPRISPGYGRWDTSCQAALLAMLPIRELGIALTPGAMMVPQKSVSFAVCFVTAAQAGRHEAARCERCGMVRCRHRMAPAAGAEEVR